MKRKQTDQILEILEELYPEADCVLEFGSRFQLLISVVLSAQTTDKQVNVVTEKLFAVYPDAETMAEAREEDLQILLRSIGMYKTKAKNILNIAKILKEQYQGQIPADREVLMNLPGVGRKTANVVLAVGFGIPALAVDTHVFRVANRIGLAKAPNVLLTEQALMEKIPKEKWIHMHHALIWHGRRVCSARKPSCGDCSLHQLCNYSGKVEKE